MNSELKTDLAVIILIKDEILHIQRCLENVFQLNPKQVFVVDSPSTDCSDKVAAEMGATVVAHRYPGNQAAQFNWALDNLPINATWILRLDADEYFFPEAIDEIKQVLQNPPVGVTAFSMQRKVTFAGGMIHHGPKVVLTRLFKYGCGRSEASEMDEHIVVSHGETQLLKGFFVDDNLAGFEAWKQKHLNYAEREARQALSGQHGNKVMYYKLPPYLRAVMYWGIRYFLWKGFLDGRAGWQWNFWQGLWYRWTVDRTIARMKREQRR